MEIMEMTTILINGVIQSGCNKNLHKRMEDYHEEEQQTWMA